MSRSSQAAAVVGVAVSIAAVYVLAMGMTSPSLAFAQVAQRLRSAQTLSFDAVLAIQADGKVLSTNRTYHQVPGKTRTEMTGEGDEHGYVVFNIPAGKALMVDAKRRTAFVSDVRGAEGRDMAAEAIEHIQNLSDENARPLGERTIGGVAATGFEITDGEQVTTVWADSATSAAVRIEILQKNFPDGPLLTTWTNIKLDEPLDPALFSIEPPEGFASQPFLPMDFNAMPAEMAAKFLGLYAEQFDGEFPPSLEDAIELLAEKLRPADPNAPPTETMMQTAFYGAAVASVTMHGAPGDDWQYYPGWKLGDAEQIVFWFHDTKNERHLAVYGDLRVEEIAEDALPPAEQP